MAYYGVKKGRSVGIYLTWDECQAQVKGYGGAVFKKFKTIEEAESFVHDIPSKEVVKKESEAAILVEKKSDDVQIIEAPNNYSFGEGVLAYVDGSYNQVEDIVGYGIAFVLDNQVLFKDLGIFKGHIYNKHRNVFGEVKGAMRAVELAMANGFNSITIVYDYTGIEHWAKGEWKANNPLTKEYKAFMEEYMRKVNVKFKKVKAHSGEDKYNDLVDSIAKIAAGV